MRVAVLSESAADEAAIRILIDGLLGSPTQAVGLPSLRTRGWPAVLQVIPAVLSHLHYQTHADAFVVVVDANHSPMHQATHEQPGGIECTCRLCQLRERVAQTQSRLRSVPERQPQIIQTAIGIAVPAIEAWYRCAVDPHVSESTWVQNLQAGTYAHIKNRLKQDVYGTERPPLELEIQRASEHTHHLAPHLSMLEDLFPIGFGALAHDVRRWLGS